MILYRSFDRCGDKIHWADCGKNGVLEEGLSEGTSIRGAVLAFVNSVNCPAVVSICEVQAGNNTQKQIVVYYSKLGGFGR